MASSEIRSAPSWRRMLAGVIDAGIATAVTRAVLRRSQPERAPSMAWLRWLRPSSELVREQLGSPGQRLLGLRTVDSRSGRRVALPRSLLLLGVGAGGQLLARRVSSRQAPEREREHERFRERLRAVNERHPPGSPEREAELAAVVEGQPGPVEVIASRSMAVALAVAVINNRLRRRLAPTTEVLARPGGDSHRP